ncbi:MAG: sigma-70 family RNA polymerase sigma factor [Blastocatellia bacterium]|nr:sigma-70 family RNA polymerase sigma factor [Blastocatellia bacterium]
MTRRQLQSRRQKFDEVLTHLDTLLRAASRIERNLQDAEDTVQETYLRAWRYFDSFEAGTNCCAWLFRIMFNVINHKRGKQARMPESPNGDEEIDNYQHTNGMAFDPLKEIEAHEVLEATKQLSEDHRSVLWLVAVEEFSYKETAEILNVPIGTVMSRLHRARRELRDLLSPQQLYAIANSSPRL